MNGLRIATLLAVALAFGLTLSAAPQQSRAAGVCAKISGVPDKKCVEKSDLGNKSVTGKKIKKKSVGNKHLTPNMQDMIQELKDQADHAEFSATINASAQRDLLVFGTFVLFAKCILGAGGEDRLEVWLRSTANGWFLPFGTSSLPSSFEFLLGFIAVAATTSLYRTFLQDGAIGPTGALLGLIYFGLGLNIIGDRCVVHGYAQTGQLD